MPKQTPLTWTDRALLARSLHRLLFKRLLGMTLTVCLLTVCGFYLTERARFSAALRDGVVYNAAKFQLAARDELNAPGLGDHGKIQKILDDFLAYGQHQQLGTVEALTVMDAKGQVVARSDKSAAGSRAELAGYLEANRYRLPFETEKRSKEDEPGKALYDQVSLNGQLFLHILIPFVNAQGNTVAFGECLFAIREGVIRDANQRMALTLALAMSLVLATAGLLYPVLLRLLRQMHTASLDLLEANMETIGVLSRASAKRDSDVDSHSYRVTIYAVRLAERLGLDSQAMRSLIKGAFLHDVGKIGVPDALLRKPGRLTPEEFAQMRLHVQHGRDIVSRARWLRDALDVIGGHHERYDGSGYDQKLAGQAIPLAARLFAVVDVFDALASPRPYKPALSLDVVLRMLEEERGSHFDPAILDVFLPMARALYDQHAQRTTEELDVWLRTNCAKYFSSDIEERLSSLTRPLE
jgi:HD-GYP domain-containing protein (c-di-GMP phosphodiesterase class II)